MRVRCGACAAAFLALMIPGGAAAATRFGMQILPSYTTGDFGGSATTDIVYVPLILSVGTERQELRVTIPYVSLRTGEPVTFAGGDVIGRPAGTAAAGPTTESGLGDIVVKDELFVVKGDESHHPWVSLIGRVKLPTADEKRGLGTGELDYGPGAGIVQPLGSRWSLLAEADYVVRGDPPGEDLRNTLWASAGVQWKPTAASSLYLFYDSRQSVLAGREAIRDATLGYDHRVSETTAFRSAVYYGLSGSAEDFGVSIGFVLKERFRTPAE